MTAPTSVATTTLYTFSIAATNSSGTGAAQSFTLTELPTVSYGTVGSSATQSFSLLPSTAQAPTNSTGVVVEEPDHTLGVQTGTWLQDGQTGPTGKIYTKAGVYTPIFTIADG